MASLKPSQLDEAEAIDGLDLHARPYKLAWMQQPWDDITRASSWLSGLADKYQPDLVHLNTLAHGAIGWKVPVLTVGHSCVMSWFEAVRGQAPVAQPHLAHIEPRPLDLSEAEIVRWGRYQNLVRLSLQASQMIAAPSATMLQALQRHYGPFLSARVIYNGRDPDDFLPATPESIVMSAGRLWDDAKNVRTLTRAAPEIDWPVMVAGSNVHPDGGTLQVENVEMLGHLDAAKLAHWYARSSIYVLPARYEPFGLTAVEAALAGNALVLGNIPSLREIWGDAAVFVDPEDSVRLAEAINALIADPHRRSTLAERAGRRALKFSLEPMVDSYIRAYGEISGRAAPAPLAVQGGQH